MASFALLDVDLYAGTSSTALDLACFANSVSVTTDVSMVMATTFCSDGWEEQIAGLRSTTWTASGPTDMATATASQTSAVDGVVPPAVRKWHAAHTRWLADTAPSSVPVLLLEVVIVDTVSSTPRTIGWLPANVTL